MKDSRLFKRIPCSGSGILTLSEIDHDVAVVNLSKGGVCLKMETDRWETLNMDEQDMVGGQLTVDGDLFGFDGRICWSSSSPGMVFFGIEFKKHDKHVLSNVLERLSILEDLPPQDSFAI